MRGGGGIQMGTHLKMIIHSFLSCLVPTLVEFRLKYLVFRSPRLLRSFGMGLALTFLCNSQIFVIDISYNYLYLHDLYSTVCVRHVFYD